MLAGPLVVALLVAQAPGLPALPETSDVAAVAGQVEATHQDGRRLSHEVAKLTGAQLTPLFMMGVLGGHRWLRASTGERARLPWHQQPWFWGSAFALTLLLWFGDKIPVVRHVVKHLKLAENKLSGIVATVVLVASFASAAAAPLAGAVTSVAGILLPSAYAADGSSGTLATLSGGAAQALAWAVGLAISVAVWLAGHSVNVIALVNPFAPLDALLRIMRLALVGLVLGAAQFGTVPGLLVAALVIAVSFAVAGWSFRLTVFGAVFSWDFLWAGDARPAASGVPAFAGGRSVGLPARTFGRLSLDGGGFAFHYRPWLVFPARRVALPTPAAVGQGLLSPVLLARHGSERQVLVRFLPRFRRSASELASVLGGLPLEDVSVVRGFKSAWAWLRSEGTATNA